MVPWLRVAPRFQALPLHRYAVTLYLERPLRQTGSQRSVLFRGAFGSVFRSLVCHDVGLECAGCPLRGRCPYPAVFAPSLDAGVEAARPDIARLRDPPRPFVLRAPRPEAAELPASVPLSLGVCVVGRAVRELPYFVVTLRRLGELGLGRERVRFRVERVAAVDAAGLVAADVVTPGASEIRHAVSPLTADGLARPGDSTARRVRVRFRTATDLRGASASGGEAPSFGTLLRRARDRASALATFFGDGALFEDEREPRALADAADRVRLLGAEIEAMRTERRSSRTGQRHPLEGIVGTAHYEGDDLATLMPWLRLAEVLGVGKHTTFGLGHLEVEVLG